MRGIKVKTKGSNNFKKILIFIALLILLTVLVNSVYGVYKKKKNADRALAQMQFDIKTLEERQEFLNDSVARLETKEGLEFEIKKKFNVALADEKVALIINEESTTTSKTATVSFWQKIKDFFNIRR